MRARAAHEIHPLQGVSPQHSELEKAIIDLKHGVSRRPLGRKLIKAPWVLCVLCVLCVVCTNGGNC